MKRYSIEIRDLKDKKKLLYRIEVDDFNVDVNNHTELKIDKNNHWGFRPTGRQTQTIMGISEER